MNKSKKRRIIFSIVLLGGLSVNADCSSEWDEFLRHPNKETLVVLEKSIAASPKRCRSDIPPLQRHRTQLSELICEGSPFAFRAALLVSECWDGGELEDFYRDAGIFFERQPLVFLQTVKEKAIKDSQLRYMIIMLPLYTVDNINLKLSVVENRIAILKTIREESLNEKRDKGISFLKKEKKNLEKIRIEMDETSPPDTFK